jgi:protein phosphatase
VLRAYGITDKGPARQTNEDWFAVDERLHLSVVADGMGGHQAGEVAARAAVDAVVEFIGRPGPRMAWPFGYDAALSNAANVLRTSIHVANMRVLELAGTSPGYAGMGTTIVAALVHRETLIAAHVGDSRLYVLRGGRLTQLTDDDSWMATVLARDPRADAAALRRHPMRNALTNVVGAKARTDVHVAERPLVSGDLIVLTTDGIHGVLEDERIERLLTAEATVDRAAASLVAAALDGGSRDNCTAVVVEYDGE